MTLVKRDYDAVVVGSGPNGLAAAITLQQAGVSVLLVEAKNSIGGGLRSAQLTLPGFIHDVCSAIHPLAACSPFFNTLPLTQHGLEFIYPAIPAAHPFDDGSVAALLNSPEETAKQLGDATHKACDTRMAENRCRCAWAIAFSESCDQHGEIWLEGNCKCIASG